MTKHMIGVAGTGAMGRGIAQLFAQAGHQVRLYDAKPGAAQEAQANIAATIQKLAEKGRLAAPEAAVARLAVAADLAEFAPCGVVIEAVFEDLAVKRDLFAKLEAVVPPETILATNTSSLLVAAIAAGCQAPERVVGLHFFNPVPLMKLVEVIPASHTDPRVIATLTALVEGTGHRAVRAADQPGFLVNHAGRGLYTEGLRLVEEQAATPDVIDMVLRDALGFRMGPFELLDLTGLDVSGPVMEAIYAQFHQEPRFRPSSLVAPRIAAGLLGRKSGAGWYNYPTAPPQAVPPPPLPPELGVWVDPAASGAAALADQVARAGARQMLTPEEAGLILIQPWGEDATGCAARLGLDATRTVAIDPLPTPECRATAMLTIATTPAVRDATLALFGRIGHAVSVINDSPGFIAQRVLACIINIAANIAQRRIAAPADIDTAVTLALGYPRGPLAWGDAVGPARILEILRNMQEATGDPRYRPSPWLTRRAALRLSLLQPDTER